MHAFTRRNGSLSAQLLIAIAAFHSLLMAPRSAAEEPQPETAQVEGTVVDLQGEPVAGATVSAFTYEPQTAETTSDASGKFSLQVNKNRAAGCPLLASHGQLLGYLRTPYESEDAPDELRLELKEPRKLLVVVSDREQQAIAGIEVAALAHYQVHWHATTDAQGRAELVVPADALLQHVIAYGKEGVDYALFRRPEEPRDNPFKLAPDYAGEIALTLTPCSSITLRVVDEKGRGLADAEVYPWYLNLPNHSADHDPAHVETLWRTKTDEDGIASLDYLPLENTHPIVLWVRKAGYVATERTNYDPKKGETELTATLLPLVFVRGTVTLADGSPAAGAIVEAAGDGYSFDDFRGSTQTKEDGTFELMVNPNEYYLVTARYNEQVAGIESRVVLNDSPDAIELRLGPGTHVFGRVTGGEDNRPVANQYVSLYRHDGGKYYELPENQKLPNPNDSRFAVSPRLVQSCRTDPLGNYDFWTGPGAHYVFGGRNEEAQKFEVTDRTEVELNFHVPLQKEVTLRGQVVLAAEPMQGVAGVKVFGYPEKVIGNHLSATTDAEGKFEVRWDGNPQLVGAFRKDNHLGTIKRIEGELTEFTLEMAPTVGVRGVLFDEETQAPAANRDVSASIRVGGDDGPFMSAFKNSANTAADGSFEIVGLVPGHRYQIQVVTEVDEEGHARSWRNLTEVEAEVATNVSDLGTLNLPAPYRPPTLEQIIARRYAGDKPEERLRQALTDARLGYQQVLVIVGPQDSAPVQQFFEPYQAITQENRGFYETVVLFHVLGFSPDQADVLEPLGLTELPQQEMIYVLRPSGEIAAQKPFSEFLSDGSLDLAAVRDFLQEQADEAQLPDAVASFQAALQQAQRENKRVLVQVSGAGCGPCVLLSRFLDNHADLVNKDYVYLKLDSRMAGGAEQIAAVRPDTSGGIPWMVILDADGNPLITSDSLDGNIGFPSEESGKEYFRSMLSTTAQNLTEEEIDELIAGLEKK